MHLSYFLFCTMAKLAKMALALRQRPIIAGGIVAVALLVSATLLQAVQLPLQVLMEPRPQELFDAVNNSTGYDHHYQSLFKNTEGIWKLPVGERCQAFFDLLYITEPDWTLHAQLDQFYHSNIDQTIEYIHHFNVYNHCFLKSSFEERSTGEDAYRELVVRKGRGDVEHRVFPWLTRQFPVFVRETGVTIGPPAIQTDETEEASKDLSKNLSYDLDKYKQHWFNSEQPLDVPFFAQWNRKSRGRGIIMTMGDMHLVMALKLIRNLRVLGTKLPLQIIHYDEISQSSMKAIIEEATKDFTAYDKDLFDEMRSNSNAYPNFKEDFPMLDITFIDTAPSVNSADTFSKFNRKFLALMFNTFKEFMFIDIDAVLFAQPEEFFETSQYKNTSSIFFKDRNIPKPREKAFRKYFKLARPNVFDNKLFEIPLIDDSIFEQEYFVHRTLNYMESGVICMDKAKYFPGLLMTYLLSTKQVATESGHGDKELFWMGQLVAGERGFAFNNHWAAFTGEVSAGREDKQSNEVCSTHPSHVSSDTDRVLWINSGATNCKIADADLEHDLPTMSQRYPNRFSTVEELHEYYNGPVNMEHILFTPSYLTPEEMQEDLQGEPVEGAVMTHQCRNYLWCGYDQVGLGKTESQRGRLLQVPDDDRLFYKYIVNCYVYGE